MSDFDIRDDRPMPSKMSLGSLDYPFDDLDIGQSFVVDAETDEDSNGRRTIEKSEAYKPVRGTGCFHKSH